RLKVRLRPMRDLKRDHTARVIMRGHALMQNLRRGTMNSASTRAPSAHRGRVHRTRPSHLTKRNDNSVSRGPDKLNTTEPKKQPELFRQHASARRIRRLRSHEHST